MSRNQPAPDAHARREATRAERASLGPAGEIPGAPPVEVLEQMDEAALVVSRLRAEGRELHLERRDDGRIHVELRDLESNVLRELTPSELLEILTPDA